MNKILLVEDNSKIAKGIICELEKSGFEVKHYKEGIPARTYFDNNKNKVDLVLLDIGLPDTSGYTVLKHIRENSAVPVLLETDHTEEEDAVLGFELGADDYIRKPFSLQELTARIKRKLGNKSLNTFEIDPNEFDVIFKGNHLKLTDRQFKILEYLINHSDERRSKEDILEYLFDYLEEHRISKNPEAKRRIFDALDHHTKEHQKQNLNTHIKDIRSKIDPDKNYDRNKYIDSKTNKGYKLKT